LASESAAVYHRERLMAAKRSGIETIYPQISRLAPHNQREN
jgi:hypothetical protein